MLSKKKEERNKHFIPPKEKPLLKKSSEGKDEGATTAGTSCWERLTCISVPSQVRQKASWTSKPLRWRWRRRKPRNWEPHQWAWHLPAAAEAPTRRAKRKTKANHNRSSASKRLKWGQTKSPARIQTQQNHHHILVIIYVTFFLTEWLLCFQIEADQIKWKLCFVFSSCNFKMEVPKRLLAALL